MAISTVQAADYPASCTELENLTVKAAELIPEMQTYLDAVGSEEERKAISRQAWAEMNEDQQNQATKNCAAAVIKMEKIITAVKALPK